jgi:mannan endo-1,4-beta-mannosidase
MVNYSCMSRKIIFVAIFVHIAILSVIASGKDIQPANPNATEDARKLLTYLYKLPERSENRLISGHLAGGSIGPTVPKSQEREEGGYRFTMGEIEYLHEVSGQWVGLIGADYCAGWIECPDPIEATMYYKQVNQGLIEYWNAGGLVVITTHQFDPRELYKDGGQCFPKNLPKGATRLDLSRLYAPGCEEYDNFRVIMNRWSEGLQELAEHGVVVMWRPFNEVRDGKWWCNHPVHQFKTLYRYTFNYMTHMKGLNNLLWVFDPARNRTDMSYYPGDDYVDIVGCTMNWDSGPASQVTNLYPQKVFGCIEFNVRFDHKKFSYFDITRDYDYMPKLRWVKDNLLYASFFMSWNRLSGPYGRGTPESVKAMYNDPVVANRGEIDWRSVHLSPEQAKP